MMVIQTVPVQTLVITGLITYLHSSRTTTSVILLTDNFSNTSCCELITEIDYVQQQAITKTFFQSLITYCVTIGHMFQHNVAIVMNYLSRVFQMLLNYDITLIVAIVTRHSVLHLEHGNSALLIPSSVVPS